MIALAWTALFAWPIVAVMLFKRYSLPVAVCATMIGGYLLLPSDIFWDLPVLPKLNKFTIPTLTALVLTAIYSEQAQKNGWVILSWIPRSGVVLGLLLMLLVGIFGTVSTNQDPLFYGPRFLVGMRLYDGFSLSLEALLLVAPLILARRVFGSEEGQRILLMALGISALIYTIPAMWEVRMSPQLHTQIYGYFPHQFLQHFRQGGYRPVVFLNHGLSLGIYLTFALISAIGLYRISRDKNRKRWLWASIWLFIVLVFAKSIGALVIAVILLPIALFLTPRLQLMAAACIAGIVMVYPMLRAADVVPVDRMIEVARGYSVERAESLAVRVRNEDILLAKAAQRPVFGWGLWSRNRVFDERGRDISITDGSWVLAMGVGGWFRYLAIFGLLCWPIIALFLSRRDRIDPVCATLALVLCAKLVDLIPNSGMIPVVWMMAGSLLGRLENDRVQAPKDTTHETHTAPDMQAGPPRYARDFSREKSQKTRHAIVRRT